MIEDLTCYEVMAGSAFHSKKVKNLNLGAYSSRLKRHLLQDSLGGVHASRFTPSLILWFALRHALPVVKLLQLVHDYRI